MKYVILKFFWIVSLSITSHAAVIVHELPEPLVVEGFGPSDVFFPIDMDGNGSVDFILVGSVSAAGIRTERANRSIIRVSPPPNIGGYVESSKTDFDIGPSLLGENVRWSSSDFVEGYVDPDEMTMSIVIQVFFSGYFTRLTERSYIGIEFESEAGTHYGYFDVSPSERLGAVPRFIVHGWAWETIPGKSIRAGAIPEPSSLMLLIATAGMVWRRRRGST